MTERQTVQEWLESRIRDAARKTAAKLRKTADDIDRIAENGDLDQIPGQVVDAVMWGLANAYPGDAATQLAEYNKAERAGHFKTEPTTEQKD